MMVVKEPVEIGSLLYRIEGYRTGASCSPDTRPRARGRRDAPGPTAEQVPLAEVPHLDLPRIYAALAYFLANRELVLAEMDADVAEGKRLARELSAPVLPE